MSILNAVLLFRKVFCSRPLGSASGMAAACRAMLLGMRWPNPRLLVWLGFSGSAMLVSLSLNATLMTQNLEPNGLLGFRSMNFINSHYPEAKIKSPQLIHGRLVQKGVDESLLMAVDIEGQFARDQKVFNSFTMHEFYFSTRPEWLAQGMSFGRIKKHWSLLDETWGLGLWQPLYKNDALRPVSQGLTGLVIHLEKPHLDFDIFASAFFIPDQGPNVFSENGQIVEGHPWVPLPPKQLNFLGVSTDVQYRVEKPDVTGILFQTSYALKARFKTLAPFDWTIAYAYKPMNQLSLAYDGVLSLMPASAGGAKGVIDLSAGSSYHSLTSTDVTYRYNTLLFGLSLAKEVPQKAEFTDKWTYQSFNESFLTSLSAQWEFEAGLISFSYLNISGGESVEQGRLAADQSGSSSGEANPDSERSQVLPDRFSWREAIKASVKWHLPLAQSQNFVNQVSYLQDLKDLSEIVSLSTEYYTNRYWKIEFGLDFLRSSNRDKSFSSFAERYLDNDRVYTGVAYVF